MPISSRVKKGSAAGLVLVSLVSGFEGLRTVAYRDPVGIPTVCFGETKNVKMGDHYTVQQCKDMLADQLPKYEAEVRSCLKSPDSIPINSYIAFVSFDYNVGSGNFCGSNLLRLANKGDIVGACNELPKWNKAMGIKLPGLVKRRMEERALCLTAVQS